MTLLDLIQALACRHEKCARDFRCSFAHLPIRQQHNELLGTIGVRLLTFSVH